MSFLFVKTPTSKKIRLDILLLDRGLCQTRAQAQALIMNGQVRVDEQIITKAGTLTLPTADVQVQNVLRYVSRGGLKLEKALAVFQMDVRDKRCLDVGASTGGFTDCLLQNGAKRVLAVDVGTNQLAWSLRTDERVAVFEKTHINQLSRAICVEALHGEPEIVVIDTSFISLSKVLPAVMNLLGDEAQIVALLKPQFEFRDFGPAEAGNFKGVVRESLVHELIVTQLLNKLLTTLALKLSAINFSPITGPKGNIEFLLHLTKENQQLETCLAYHPLKPEE